MVNYRISLTASIILVLVAIIADILSLIPFVGDVSGPVFWILVTWYLWKKGCGLFNVRRFVTEILSTVIEVIPALQALPATAVGIIIVLFLIRFEDKTGISIKSKSINTSARRPLYTSDANGQGIRNPEISKQKVTSQINDGVRPPNGGIGM